MSFTYSDLTDATGKIRLNVIMSLAAGKARAEVEGCAQIGWVRSYRTVFAQELVFIWCSAKAARDSKIAAAERAALSAHEQAARTLELGAALAETVIPPRPATAAALRERADATRATGLALHHIAETLAA